MHGISTRKVDDLVQALGVGTGMNRSDVSRICSQLDRDLIASRNRPLDHVDVPFVFADATYIKGRIDGRLRLGAVVIATGVTRTGDREVLGVAVDDSEDGAFCPSPSLPEPHCRRREAQAGADVQDPPGAIPPPSEVVHA